MGSPKLAFGLKGYKGSDVLSLMKGLEQLSPDICRWAIVPFRVTDLSSAKLTSSDNKRISSDFDFICDSIVAHVESLPADTRTISQFVTFNLRESGRNYDFFPDPIPMSLLVASIGGNAATAAQQGDKGFACRIMRVPYIFSAGSEIRADFTVEAAIGASARYVDLGLVGYFIRKDLIIQD